ncbi:GNAT family N-acetyltransferase [Tissierella sp. MSJ-40]|uniref:GNAT family N-acetyltransferase n=1 Tax=Tissierella simiarum TaxID=2841534 RepID=A0ABS6EA81_9FIRM|nr:GNAT family N-acetyltransferase [Tissierella simiarum]MBU5439446.1 GNAT family N-acetyltransferase [Tissierella simiarum]
MLDFTIRPIKTEDAPYINEMRRMDGVRENTLGIISERLTKSEDFIKGLSENAHMLVAEVEEDGMKKVVGIIGLHVSKNPRLRHSADIGIMVNTDYQGKGIGTALFKKIIDIADNWLMLVRLELTVFVDNDKAIKLYQSLGFQIEGTKKYAAIRNGVYTDEYLMARYNLK